MTTRQDLLDYVLSNFNERAGERRAWFDIPQITGDPVRAVYVVYAGRAANETDACDWMLDIFTQLKALGGVYWYWRTQDMIRCVYEDSAVVIRTRIVVLDKDLRPVRLEDVIKIAGESTKRIEK